MSEVMFGRHRLIAELGQGGMADVFLAAQAGPAGSGFSKLSVIKRLRDNLAEDPEFVTMLLDEARIAARLNHANVVQTNEIGEVDGHYFIAMEFLDGQPLHRIQRRITIRKKEGKPSLITREMEYVIVMEALAGLHHAHELQDYDGTPLQIVHRDVTPQNIFVTYAGQVKVVDFGIAKAAGRASETRQGIVKGKVRYMAPEQAAGRAVDRRVDIFAAGVMLWEAATGRRLWAELDDLAIVRQLVSGSVNVSPRSVDPSVPEALDEIVKKALAVSPNDRYATAEQMRNDLEQFMVDSGKLVEARRALAPAICEMFKDKRSELKAVIESQLASSVGRMTSIPAVPQSDPGPTSWTGVSSSIAPQKTGPNAPLGPNGSVAPALPTTTIHTADERAAAVTVPTTHGHVEVSLPPPAGRNQMWLLLSAAALFALVVMGVGWRLITTASRDGTDGPNPASSANEVSIRLEASPPETRVRIDGGEQRPVPVDLHVQRDDRDHMLTFEADGYLSKIIRTRFDRSITHSIALKPTVDPAAAPSTSAARTPAPAPAPFRGSPRATRPRRRRSPPARRRRRHREK